ncbi:MAG: bifunctional alpha,alpha-trehalose-phosphate synthase (UDP-forming)/trehalose-phosphatase [Bdellovibrionaceae bacterium]|nr:bifunctional alpha,alpha-trehalose-phosphate synthase (UDP-forming)/trehalose-phosphatase [Pseudobdellovibrionaceae bacterium]
MSAKSGELKRGSGGLVSALLGVQLDQPFFWFGFETDENIAKSLLQKSADVEKNLEIRPVVLEKSLYESYYDRFSNDVLWPLFHYEGNHVFFRRQDWESYTEANRRMAEEILKIAEANDTVWIHDFHFLLLGQMLKEANPDLKIGFFLHTPFPSSEIFRQLPVREEVLRAMLRFDLIGFHEHSYLRHFTVCLKTQLGIESTFFKAETGDHVVHLGVYPISIDIQGFKKKSSAPKIAQLSEKFRQTIRSPFLVLGIDRLDYSKGLELKLRGFRRLLQKFPDLRGQVNLLQVAVPTRVKVPSYIRLKKDIDRLVGTINGEFGKPGYTPVQYIFNSVSEAELLALYKRSDCALITSKRDGMNLVAMEYTVAQDPDNPGVIVLSEFAGAASLLGQAIFINPWDEDSIADALYQAYTMPSDEKRERLEGLQDMLSKYSATEWAKSFLRDLDSSRIRPPKRPLARLCAATKDTYGRIFEKVRQAEKCHLILDYDGTLCPLQKRPELAVLSETQKARLQKLGDSFSIHIVSGRSREFLDAQFPESPFHLVAEHGAFRRLPGSEWKSRISSDIQSWFNEIEKIMQDYSERVPLSFVEKKSASLVWHFRQSPPDFAAFQARKLDDELQIGFSNLPVSVTIGSKIVEARAIECNKGSFLRWLLESEPAESSFVCLGDDHTDEDMFRALDTRGISIKVGHGETAAHCRIPTQEEVLPFLEELVALRGKGFEPVALPTSKAPAERP